VSAGGPLGPRRFVAATATEALSMVKQAIGPDAILLSNREVDDGIEIIAMAQDQFKEIAPRATAKSQTPGSQVVFSQRTRTEVGSFQEGFPVSAAADRAPRPEGLRQMSDSAIRTANHKLVIADVATSPMRNADGSPVFAPEVAAAHFHSETGASIARHGAQATANAHAAQGQGAGQVQITAANGHSSAVPGSPGAPALNELAEKLMGQVAEVKHLLESHCRQHLGTAQRRFPRSRRDA